MATTLINTKYLEAQRILGRAKSLDADDFIGQTFALTGDSRLVSPRINISEKYIIAQTDLIKIVSKPPLVKEILENLVGKLIDRENEVDQDEKEETAQAESEPTLRPKPEEKKGTEEKEVAVYEAGLEEKEQGVKHQYEKAEEELGDSFTDYYAVLDVDRNATQKEIRAAYRKKLQEVHPDHLGWEYNPESTHYAGDDKLWIERSKQFTEVYAAYEILSNEEGRKTYNGIWDVRNRKRPKTETTVTTAAGGTVPLSPTPAPTLSGRSSLPSGGSTPQGTAGFDRLVLTIKQPTDITPPVAPEFTKTVNDAGFIDIDQATIATEGIGAYLPTGFSGEQLTTALNLYAHGVRSSQFENTVDKKIQDFPIITGRESESLYGISYLMKVFEESNEKQTGFIQNTFSPEINIQESPAGADIATQPGQIVFASKDNIFQPVIREAIGMGADFAKEQVKKFAVGAIKKVGKKVAEEAIKKGAGIAVKAGVSAAAQAAGTVVPGIGNAVMLVITEVLPRVIGAIKKLFTSLIPKKIKEWLQENKKFIAAAALGLVGMGLVFANPFFILGGIGLGAVGASLGGFAGLGAAIFFGIVAPYFTSLLGIFLATAVGMVLLIAFCFLIINSGSYVVPYNPSAIVPGDQQLSRYFKVEKYADEERYKKYSNGDREVVYTINIIPTQGSLSNISFSSKCNVYNGSTTPPSCPSATKVEVNYGVGTDCTVRDSSSSCPSGSQPCFDKSIVCCVSDSQCPQLPPSPPDLISPSTPYKITYRQAYDSNYKDSLIIDSFTVTADSGGGNRSTSAGSASLALGNPPSSCPTIWPIAGADNSYRITQGPQAGVTHAGQEAIDIAPEDNIPFPVLRATHDGIVSQVTYHPTYGNIVRIDGNCTPAGSFRTYYGHLSSVLVSVGGIIAAGSEIGIMGRTGSSATGVHVHYMFENNQAIIMDLPYIPIDRIKIYGCTLSSCNILIP